MESATQVDVEPGVWSFNLREEGENIPRGEFYRFREGDKYRAWKTVGYPGFARWIASSNDVFIIRRFGALNARVILLMQDQIVRKEMELDAIDFIESQEGRNDSLRGEKGDEREHILLELKALLKEYSGYIPIPSIQLGFMVKYLWNRRIRIGLFGTQKSTHRSG